MGIRDSPKGLEFCSTGPYCRAPGSLRKKDACGLFGRQKSTRVTRVDSSARLERVWIFLSQAWRERVWTFFRRKPQRGFLRQQGDVQRVWIFGRVWIFRRLAGTLCRGPKYHGNARFYKGFGQFRVVFSFFRRAPRADCQGNARVYKGFGQIRVVFFIFSSALRAPKWWFDERFCA